MEAAGWNRQLARRAAEADAEHAALEGQLESLRRYWTAAAAQNCDLEYQLSALRYAL